MKKFFHLIAAALVGSADAVMRCGEYVDRETVLVRRTTDGKFNAAVSDDLAGTAIDGTGNRSYIILVVA